MRTIASFRVARSMLRTVGVDPWRYHLLIGLFRTLGARKELFGNLGTDRHAMQLTSLGLLIPGAIFGVMAVTSTPLATYSLTVLALSSLVLFLLLVIEASNSFLNPAEATVLAHQPITGATYFAAKLSYLLVVVIRAQASLNVPAAFAGLVKAEARWFYPLTHILAACAAGIFIALVVCALFGMLFRLLPASRLRTAALWMQLGVATAPFVVNLILPTVRAGVSGTRLEVIGADMSIVPLSWFTAIALAGHEHPYVFGWPAIASMAISALFVAYGVRSLSVGYLSRIVHVLRTSQSLRRRGARRSIGARLVRGLTGRQSGRAAFSFLWPMMRRDWQFRRAMAQSALPLLFFGPAIVLGGRDGSPLGSDRPGAVGLLPELVPLSTLMVAVVLAYSDHYRGAWVFRTVPTEALRSFVRGIFWSLWLPLILLPFALALLFFLPYWSATDALIFSGYGISIASLLFGLQLFFLEGLPFSSPPKADRAYTFLPIMFFGPIVMGMGWFVQWRLIFPSRGITLLTALLAAAASWLLARAALATIDRRVARDLAYVPSPDHSSPDRDDRARLI